MLKLLSSAAVALVLTIPGWAQAAGETDSSEKTKVETGSSASGEMSTETDGTAAADTETVTDEALNPEQDGDTAATDEEIPDISESQPGTITGEDVQVDEDQPDAGSGTTE